jgi:hypothetical protein
MTKHYDDAMKRFLVLGGIRLMPGRSGLLAPARGYQSRMGRPNHKLVLRNAFGPYNYRA